MVFDSKDSKEKAARLPSIRHIRIVDQEIDSRELFQAERELSIRHKGMIYRLRLTGLNKLILTK